MPRTLVAIPALNESDTLAGVVAEVRAALGDADVLVVDDGSTDGTAEVARAAGAAVLVLPFNVGVGGAMRTAFRYARLNGFDRLVQVDADGQHVAADASLLLAALSGPDAPSVVIGGRFASGYPTRGPRRWAIQVLARSLSRVCGTPLTDTTSGFRAADARAIALFAEHYPAEYLGDTVESLVLAARAGLTIREVPVTMRPRQGGAASHTPFRASLQLGRALLALYVALAGRRPTPAIPQVAADPRAPGSVVSPASGVPAVPEAPTPSDSHVAFPRPAAGSSASPDGPDGSDSAGPKADPTRLGPRETSSKHAQSTDRRSAGDWRLSGGPARDVAPALTGSVQSSTDREGLL